MKEKKNASVMSLNGENGKAVKHHLKYIKFLRDKKNPSNVNTELNMENSTCLRSVHLFIGKPTRYCLY